MARGDYPANSKCPLFLADRGYHLLGGIAVLFDRVDLLPKFLDGVSVPQLPTDP